MFGVGHYFWACRLRNRISWCVAERTPRLDPDWVTNLQNWFVRVFLPIVVTTIQGNTPEVLGFRLRIQVTLITICESNCQALSPLRKGCLHGKE